MSDETGTLMDGIVETIKTIVYALLIAGVFRTLFFQPFWIPSGSMKDIKMRYELLGATSADEKLELNIEGQANGFDTIDDGIDGAVDVDGAGEFHGL